MSETIMTVDDSPSLRQMVSFTLRMAGFSVAEAADGAEGLKLAQSSVLSMIVTDLHMPNMDGIEMIRRIREIPSYKYVPIVLLTTESEIAKKAEAKAAGATGWIIKPFQPEHLLAIVKKVMR